MRIEKWLCLIAYESLLDSANISAVHFGNRMSGKIWENAQQYTNVIEGLVEITSARNLLNQKEDQSTVYYTAFMALLNCPSI